ncbi:hypothetical protein AX17_002074 [Amanita inopinata Kibby_2008]|nr:hypothetical protein AX17_002074 [Amanita inopinata Kibby_2008]
MARGLPSAHGTTAINKAHDSGNISLDMPSSQTAAPAAAAPAPRAPEREESTFRRILGIAQQVLLVWTITQLATRYFQKPSVPDAVQTTGKPGDTPPQVNPWLLPPTHASLAWPLGQKLDMHVYLSSAPNGNVFNQWMNAWRKDQDEGLPHFVWENITLGDYNDARVVEYEVRFPERVLRNGSLWADIFLAKDGADPNPHNSEYDSRRIHHIRKLLTPYMPRARARKEKNLLSSSSEEGMVEAEEQTDIIVSHWHKNLTLALVSDAVVVQYDSLPPPVSKYVHLVPGKRDETGTKGFYNPIIFPNEFWHLKQHYVEVNASTPSLPLQIVFQPMSYMKFQLFASMTHGFDEAVKQQGASAGAELDEVKRMLLETNSWLLALTAIVSVLHVVFEMLAFKSDVSHWRQKKELTGVSVRTIVTNVFVQIVILLYLIDNNENTSWMILFGSATGVLIEAWKITKAVDIKIVPAPVRSLLPYRLDIRDKHALSEDEKKTQEYDKLAFRYVSYVTIPTLAAYTIYSLVYESHKGWYSFIISTLTSFVYMFGFAQLIPQLIINYKLKSVAHMPMKAMVYKTLSTVVDDFFAFCIKMPFLHRLACFRDDVVFLIFLYQRWIYRVDPKRVNEYGQVLNAAEESETKKDK